MENKLIGFEKTVCARDSEGEREKNGRCCVCGIGSRTDFSHLFEMFDDANMRSGLYPFFDIALLNDFGSFALCILSSKHLYTPHNSVASGFVG